MTDKQSHVTNWKCIV